MVRGRLWKMRMVLGAYAPRSTGGTEDRLRFALQIYVTFAGLTRMGGGGELRTHSAGMA